MQRSSVEGWNILYIDLTEDLGVVTTFEEAARMAKDPFVQSRMVTLAVIDAVNEGDYERAHVLAGVAYRLDTENSTAAGHYIGLLNVMGGFEEAEVVARRALARDPENFTVLANMANALSLQGKNHEARDYFERALQVRPDREDVRSLYEQAIAASQTRDVTCE